MDHLPPLQIYLDNNFDYFKKLFFLFTCTCDDYIVIGFFLHKLVLNIGHFVFPFLSVLLNINMSAQNSGNVILFLLLKLRLGVNQKQIKYVNWVQLKNIISNY